MNEDSIAVFCGARRGVPESHLAAAAEVGRAIASAGAHLVYGAGGVGMMGAVARAALENGGRVTGVIPDFMVRREWAMKTLESLRIVKDMAERKQVLSDLAGAFAVLPGGIGTLDEYSEMITWNQLDLHASGGMKPIGFLNTDGYFDDLLAFQERAVRDGYVEHEVTRSVFVCDDPRSLVDELVARLRARHAACNEEKGPRSAGL